MALGKVDLSKQIVIPQNVWISAYNKTERHIHQRKIILKTLIAD